MRKNIVFMNDFIEARWNVPMANVSGDVAQNLVLRSAPVLTESNVQNDYAKKLIEVNQFMIGILKSEIPAVYPAPAHLSEYAEQLKTAQASALRWNSTINSRLLSVPKDSIENLNNLKELFEKAVQDAKDLQSDPQSDYLRKQLANKVKQSKRGIEDIISEVEDLINKLDLFHSDMPKQAEALKAISKLMLQDSAADSKKVKELQDAINKMNREIDSLTAAIIGLGIADGAALVLSGLALLAGPVGMVTWIFTGAAIAVATTYIVLDAIQISALKDSINAKAKEIGDYNTAIAVLNTQADTYQKFADTTIALQENLKYMIVEWKKIVTGLEEVEKEIETASAAYDKNDWKSVEEDFTKAREKCELITGPIQNLDISNMQGSNAKIEIGMSPAEVKKRMDNSNTVSIVDYIRKLG